MESARETLRLHVKGQAIPIGTSVASLKSVAECENTRPSLAHPPEKPVNLEEQNAALQKRALLANNYWGSFFSEMPLRESNLPSSADSRAMLVRPDGKTLTSPVSINSFEVGFELER